jgi:DNA (cytosine-5)-methyltransferase 1
VTVYYNEIDTFAAAWLRNLMSAGLIPQGEVDERSILDVRPDDLRGFRQAHFFAGIAGWSRALYLAGWPEDKEVWTGSCPCQPLSCAGQQKGHADERHLWPAFHRLISECKPSIIFGEQVAGALGREWLAGIRADLENSGYACGASDLCAASVGAPHIRQRLYWFAVGNSERAGLEGHAGHGDDRDKPGRVNEGADRPAPEASLFRGSLADADEGERGWWAEYGERFAYGEDEGRTKDNCEPSWRCQNGFWEDAEWRIGADGKSRRVKPEVCLLASRIPARMGRLRGFGNAIVPQVGAEFIKAVMECQS